MVSNDFVVFNTKDTTIGQIGIPLRDLFAAFALANPRIIKETTSPDGAATYAYEIADAMLLRRED